MSPIRGSSCLSLLKLTSEDEVTIGLIPTARHNFHCKHADPSSTYSQSVRQRNNPFGMLTLQQCCSTLCKSLQTVQRNPGRDSYDFSRFHVQHSLLPKTNVPASTRYFSSKTTCSLRTPEPRPPSAIESASLSSPVKFSRSTVGAT